MDIVAARSLQISTFVTFERLEGKHGESLKLSPRFREKRLQVFGSANWQSGKPSATRCMRTPLKVARSCNNSPASTLETGGLQGSVIDEELTLKSNSQEIEQHLNGRCIYLVGMMGSGKTTVGKILSQVLDYDFYDCDELVEDEVGGTSVADIFKHYGEGFFRERETGVLRKLSVMERCVIATGGGAVTRPINWKYMHKGISIWLDVPVKALAQRITAVGTESRPLLHNEAGDAYTQTLRRLSSLLEERFEAYANANARVSLENMAAKLDHRDVLDLSPTTIALEALKQIMAFLKSEDGYYAGC
ncbi:shikimate kinase, chloroplastic-like isoform X2 [Prosopis cineraria]|uniref:shikimate kinase, chloroplastic-like isoform X2 n=1 Tax=Prosopis cineraria TaxID=364024 RepID=UPI00240FE7A5|nr:shikimate kinase, chloroplastic-like isoform X2 [Prosopis cineraria]